MWISRAAGCVWNPVRPRTGKVGNSRSSPNWSEGNMKMEVSGMERVEQAREVIEISGEPWLLREVHAASIRRKRAGFTTDDVVARLWQGGRKQRVEETWPERTCSAPPRAGPAEPEQGCCAR